MLDTPNSCLLDVTNNTTITTLVSISKNGTSQDEFDQAPPLSSPSSVSTISSPSSLTEVSMTNAATTLVKRPFSTPTDKNECYLDSVTPSTTTDIGQYYWCRYCNITESSLWQHGPFGENTCCNTCYERKNSEDQRNCTLDWGINYYPNRPLDQSKAESTPFLSSTTVLNNVTSKRRRIIESPPDESSTIAPTTTLSSQQSTLTSSDTVHYPIDTSISTTKGKKSTMRSCDLCQSSQTPMWRKGPDGLNTLCNACGLRYSKFCRGILSEWKTVRPSSSLSSISSQNVKSKKNNNISTPIIGTTTKKLAKQAKTDNIRDKKVFLKAGMYSNSISRQKNKHKQKMDPSLFKFSLPLHQGLILLETQMDFRLPFDIMEDYESGRLFNWVDLSERKKPSRFVRILHNAYVERKPRKEPSAVCQCSPPKEGGRACGEDCLNRMMFIECDPSTCPSGELCSNQRFKKREFVKHLEIYLTDGRGWGLRTKEPIQQGTLITEYRGEVISDKTCQERRRTIYKHQTNFYFLDYHKGEVIDACTKGSEARFINHGCDPNCHIEKWSRRGEYHLGVFASKNIPANSELFYDYNFSLFDTEAIGQECHCGSANCRGFLGKRSSNSKKIV